MAVCLSTLSVPVFAEERSNNHCDSPPVTTITAPVAGAWIGGASTHTITGTAASPGTGVLKVKVSTNGGRSWHLATDTSGNKSWATWSFTWKMSSGKHEDDDRDDDDRDDDGKKAIKDGAYVILSRAKSHRGCVEPVGAGVTVTVDNTRPVTKAAAAVLHRHDRRLYARPCLQRADQCYLRSRLDLHSVCAVSFVRQRGEPRGCPKRRRKAKHSRP
jgi:hypothetical protein